MATYIDPEELKRQMAAARAAGYSEDQINRANSRFTTSQQSDSGGFITRNLPTIGSVLGSVLAAPLGGIGAVGGSAAGGALGEVLRERLTGEKTRGSKVGKEALLGGLGGLGGEVIGKVGSSVASKLLGKGAATAAEETASKGATGFLKRKATNAVLQTTPSATAKAAELGRDLQGIAGKWLPKLGTNYDEVLGSVASKGNGGSLGAALSDAEKVIQSTATTAGNNVRISGDEIINGLKSELKSMRGQLGSEEKAKALQSVIDQATKKYKNGVTVKQALGTLREANSKFGKSILETTGDAVAKSAQKIEANTLRASLKNMFPDIAGALDTQAEVLTLKPILADARAKVASGKLSVGRLDITRPGTIIDALMNNPTAAGKVLSGASGVERAGGVLGMVGNTASRLPGTPAMALGNVSTRVLEGGTPEQSGTTPTAGIPIPGTSSSTTTKTTGNALLTKDQISQLMLQDLMTTGGKYQSVLQGISDMIDASTSGNDTLSLSDTAIKQVNDTKSALGSLQGLSQTLAANEGTTGPILGSLRVLNPYDSTARTVQAEIDRVRQVVGKALEGGVLRKEDEDKYKKILPTIKDTPTVAQEKIRQLYTRLSTDLENYVTTQRTYGKGAGQTSGISLEQLSY